MKGKREMLIRVLRIVPAVVALYTAVHTVNMVLQRYNGQWYAYLLLGGGIVLETLLFVGFELLHQNMVHGRQRITALVMVVFASVFCTLTVIQQNHGLVAHNMADIIMHIILPNAPIIGLWLTIWFFLTDPQARLDSIAAEREYRIIEARLAAEKKGIRDLKKAISEQSGNKDQRMARARKAAENIEGAMYNNLATQINQPEQQPAVNQLHVVPSLSGDSIQ